MIDWVPVVFVIFKLAVLGIGMFYAVKWHYDQGKKGKKMDTRALVRAGAKVTAVFAVALLAVGLVTVVLTRMLHLNLSS